MSHIYLVRFSSDDDSAIFVDDRSSSSLVNSDISTNAVYETSQINNNDMSTIQNPFIANNNNKGGGGSGFSKDAAATSDEAIVDEEEEKYNLRKV